MINANFLIVDSSSTVRKLILQAIKGRLGAKKIFQASNGIEGLKALAEDNIDFIISGWEMEKMNGREFLHEIRNSNKWKDTPFIMISSHDEKEFASAAEEEGATSYLLKPFTTEQLENSITGAWSGANKRKSSRFYSIPKHKLAFKAGSQSYPAQLLNISRGGAMIRLDYNFDLKLLKTYELELDFEPTSAKPNGLSIRNLFAIPTRVELENSMQDGSKSCLMGLWFGAKPPEKETEEKLEELLTWIQKLVPSEIG